MTMKLCMSAALWGIRLTNVPLLLAVDTDPLTLAADDECVEGGGNDHCAVHALQLQGAKRGSTEVPCRTSRPGDACWNEVQWAKSQGVQEHPEWYPGLTSASSIETFQCNVHSSKPEKCPPPCGVPCRASGKVSPPACHTATHGEACWKEVHWAKKDGISQHPEWYTGLLASSSFEEFQCHVHRTSPQKCPKPCGMACIGAAVPAGQAPVPVRESNACQGREDANACLCVFDIDRTLTAKQGAQSTCPGTAARAGIADTAYGGGHLVMSALAAAGMNSTFCKSCYLGICSHGDGSGQFSRERKEFLGQVLRSGPQDNLRLKPSNAAWSDMEHLSPYVVDQPDGLKHVAVLNILRWYGQQEVCIPKANTYFFDDKDVNIAPFRGTGLNAHQISCNSRDGHLGHGEVGRCGAAPAEISRDKGVTVCKIDCQWSDWSAWSPCSKTCGGGTRQHTRFRFVWEKNGGATCHGRPTHGEACNVAACPTTTTTTTTAFTTADTTETTAAEATGAAVDSTSASEPLLSD